MDHSFRHSQSGSNIQPLPKLVVALEDVSKMPQETRPVPEDHARSNTSQWSIVSPGSQQSSGAMRKQRIGEVIRDTSIRRKPQKFPDWAVTVLTQWFMDHSAYPYPTPEEKVPHLTILGYRETIPYSLKFNRRCLLSKPSCLKYRLTIGFRMHGVGDQRRRSRAADHQ